MKKILSNLFVVFVVFLFVQFVAGDDALPPLTADDLPIDQAQQKQVRGFITDLGDANWQKREEATQALQRVGEPALPLLKEALENPDPEIRARAEALIAILTPQVQMEDETIIMTPGAIRITGNLFAQGRLSITTGPEPAIIILTTTRFAYKSRQFTFVRKWDGKAAVLNAEIKEPKDAEETARVIEAIPETAFAQKEPVLFKIYKKFAGDVEERQNKLRLQYSKMIGIP